MINSKQEDWNTTQPNFQPENKKLVAGILALLLGDSQVYIRIY